LQFIIRRILVALVIVCFRELNGIQVQLIMFINLFTLITSHKAHIYRKKRANRQERTNESFISLCTILLVLFTDYCDSVEFQYYIGGWSFIALFSLCISYNIGLLIMDLINNARLHLIK
jgi:uncharacterized integral membrane protein